jgi:hypothetical protein
MRIVAEKEKLPVYPVGSISYLKNSDGFLRWPNHYEYIDFKCNGLTYTLATPQPLPSPNWEI